MRLKINCFQYQLELILLILFVQFTFDWVKSMSFVICFSLFILVYSLFYLKNLKIYIFNTNICWDDF